MRRAPALAALTTMMTTALLSVTLTSGNAQEERAVGK